MHTDALLDALEAWWASDNAPELCSLSYATAILSPGL